MKSSMDPGKNGRLCSVHFVEKSFYKTDTNKVQLLKLAVPTIFPDLPLSCQIKQVS